MTLPVRSVRSVRAAAAASFALAASGLTLELAQGPVRTPVASAGQLIAVLGALGLIGSGAMMTRRHSDALGAGRHRLVPRVTRHGLRLPRRLTPWWRAGSV